MAAIQLKNILKKAYHAVTNTDSHYGDKKNAGNDIDESLVGQDESQLIDEQGKQILQEKLVNSLMASQANGETKITNLYLEIISIMSRRYF